MDAIITYIQAAVIFGTVLMLGALGEILTEKSGNLNLGVPGIMYLGGISSLAGVFFYENAVDTPNKLLCVIIALLCGLLGGMFGGLIYSFLTISLRANQNVTGLAITIFGTGVANFFGGLLNKSAGGVGQIRVDATSEAFRANIPFLANLGVVGRILFYYGFMVYLAVILAVLMQLFFNKTRIGLNLRAVGENPATADAAGVNVTRYKYLATCIGAGISGLGGVFFVMDYTKGTWSNGGDIEALGWLAVALVIFTSWKPVNAIWGAYFFGALYWLSTYIPVVLRAVDYDKDNKFLDTVIGGITNMSRGGQELFKITPYVATIIVLIIVSLRKKRENLGPASLGQMYFREER